MQQGLYYRNQLCLRRHKEAEQLGDKEEEFILPFLNIVYSENKKTTFNYDLISLEETQLIRFCSQEASKITEITLTQCYMN